MRGCRLKWRKGPLTKGYCGLTLARGNLATGVGMRIKPLALFAVVAFTTQPVWAQSVAVSPGSLLADGYEIKAINDVSSDEQKVIWPASPVNPYIMITLQKGVSVAVCALSMANWISIADATLKNAALCTKR
jgi:hypothetical protein